ncbi:MAG: hypothetical protein ACRDMZ_04465 [Solirubrobacteraceae bacterium]
MGKGKRNRASRGPDGGGVETTVFDAFVSASDGRPFVQMTCALDDVPVFAVKMSPATVTALGLRAIQSAIEAERDAGLVAFLAESGMEERLIGGMLVGVREHRQQFDTDAGSMRPLGEDDPSELRTDDEPDGPADG